MTLLISILILLVIIDATGDALKDIGKQVPSHILEATQVAIWFIFAHLIQVNEVNWYYLIWYVVFYISVRIYIFNPIRNKIKGDILFDLGNSNLWDQFMKRNAGFVYFMNLFFLVGSIWRLLN